MGEDPNRVISRQLDDSNRIVWQTLDDDQFPAQIFDSGLGWIGTRSTIYRPFENKRVGRIGSSPWPPRSPDPNPFDFCLGGVTTCTNEITDFELETCHVSPSFVILEKSWVNLGGSKMDLLGI